MLLKTFVGIAVLTSAVAMQAAPAGRPGATVSSLLQAMPARAPAQPQRRPTTVNAQPSAPKPSGIHPAVVRVVAPGNGSVSFGSGTLVDVKGDRGLVITNYHVINEATGDISVHFPDGFYSLATVCKIDRDWDLAALSIKRPATSPVPLAATAPQLGEPLTIAGYGSGQYRAATGRCTTYVSPGASMPFEMVELAAKARQGDSGGPILNRRGELAGVLFGEGGGRTAGSYCGRVKWFLASLTDQPALPQTVPNAPFREAIADAEPSMPPLTAVPRQRHAFDMSPVEPPRIASVATSRPSTAPQVRPPAPETNYLRIPESTSSPSDAEALGWNDIAGLSLGDQLKTFLAIVGCCAVALHLLKASGGK